MTQQGLGAVSDSSSRCRKGTSGSVSRNLPASAELDDPEIDDAAMRVGASLHRRLATSDDAQPVHVDENNAAGHRPLDEYTADVTLSVNHGQERNAPAGTL